jgi:hypothetical protein
LSNSGFQKNINDMPPNSLRNPNVVQRMKQWKKKKVGAHSLACNTSGVRRCVGALGWDYDKLTSKSSR